MSCSTALRLSFLGTGRENSACANTLAQPQTWQPIKIALSKASVSGEEEEEEEDEDGSAVFTNR